jgi:hypothetical protein
MSVFKNNKNLVFGIAGILALSVLGYLKFFQPEKPVVLPETFVAPPPVTVTPKAPVKKLRLLSTRNAAAHLDSLKKSAESTDPSREPASQKLPLSSEQRLEKLKQFFSSWGHGGEWEYTLDEDSFPTTISTPQIPGLMGKPEVEVQFTQEFMGSLGFSNEEIKMDRSTKRSGMFIQYVQGYEVYGGFLQLFYNPEEQTLFMMASHIKNIQNPRIDLSVSKEALQQILQSNFSNLKFEEKPKIFVHPDNQSELAWVVTATDSNQKNYRLLYSTSTGSELEKIPLFIQE